MLNGGGRAIPDGRERRGEIDGVTESHTVGLEPTLTEINDCGNDNYTLLSLLGHS